MTAVLSLKSLTDKKYIYFFNSGDDAIFFLMNHLKAQGLKKILIPDMGGWFSYRKFPQKIGLDIVEIKTDDALIIVDDLKSKLSKDSFLLINSLGGYFVSEPMDDISRLCKENNVFLINDVSGSIGTRNALQGDFCVGSFGHAKPLEIGSGGFIGCNTRIAELDNALIAPMGLDVAISILEGKLLFWKNIHKNILKDFASYDVLHKNSDGINIVIAIVDDKYMNDIITYCNMRKLEFVKCPSYIKVKRSAISIEVKRVKYTNSQL
jgi:dTDP-4-amino-4,6-dideoxygalactose transaminase